MASGLIEVAPRREAAGMNPPHIKALFGHLLKTRAPGIVKGRFQAGRGGPVPARPIG
jgi:hypothetical protein